MALSQKQLVETLDRLKARRDLAEVRPGRAEDYAPLSLGLNDRDTTVFEDTVDRVGGNSARETQHVVTMAQNERNFQEMVLAQQRLERAQKAIEQAQRMQQQRLQAKARNDGPGFSGGLSKKDQNYVNSLPIPDEHRIKRGSVGPGGRFRDPTPFNINAPLRTVRTPYGRITVNSSHANNFVAFLRALNRTGYKVNSLGSYANRNIAGTNTKSLHAYGLAIDINPSQNPVTYNGKNITNLPKGIGRLAAKYDLVWGGNWNGSKRDPMHFSKPWFGTK